MESPSDLSPVAVHDGLRTRYLGRAYSYLLLTDSTQNAVAHAAAQGAKEGLMVVAEEQTAGRGRFRRAWVAPPGGSLSVSILLRPPAPALPFVVMAAALATARAIRAAAPDLSPEIKWPNDILLSGKKTCGMLLETAHGPKGPLYCVLGIGVNVNWDPSQVPEIAATATSLSVASGGRPISRRILLQRLLEELEPLYEEAKRDGSAVYRVWRSRLVTLGRRVNVQGGDVVAEGIAEDVDATGALLVRTDEGLLLTVNAGDVTLSA